LARSSLQWGHGDEAVEEADRPPRPIASSRLQWGHGDEAVEELHGDVYQYASSGFNGATAMKPWKSIPSIESKTVIAKLQWGHGDEAVEDD